LEIRKSLPSDAAGIAEADALIFSDAWREEDILRYIVMEGSMCYTAIRDGKIAAYMLGRLIAPEGEIYRIATLPEYRQRGIAYRLLDYAVKSEMESGLEDLFLEVRTKNLPARSLYLSYGFAEVGVRRGYYKNPDDDAIIMVKSCGGRIKD